MDGKEARAKRLRLRSGVIVKPVRAPRRRLPRPGVGGRPTTAFPSRVSDNFCTFLNARLDYCTSEGVPVPGIGLYTDKKFFFNCDCGIFGHCTYRTMESVVKIDLKLSGVSGASDGIPCRICKDLCDSDRERRVRDMLVSIMGAHPYVYTVNDRVAGGNLSADFFLPEIGLVIMVDGEGHTEDVMYDLTPDDQREIDSRFNNQARMFGYNVVRLHHHDVDHAICAGKIKQGMVLSRRGRKGMLLYSLSYTRMGMREEYSHGSFIP